MAGTNQQGNRPQVNNPDVHPDAPLGGGGPGHFRVPRNAGPLTPEPLSDSRPTTPAATTKTVSGKVLLQDVRNVDRSDGGTFDAAFDWLTPFMVGGVTVFLPEKLDQQGAARQRMLDLFAQTPLAQHLFAQLARPTQRDRLERSAWILATGELTPVQLGKNGTVEMSDLPTQGTVVGCVHTHPTTPTEIAPPSLDDYDRTLLRYPWQFVVESARGRVWGQFPPNYTSLLGWIFGPNGVFQALDGADPLAGMVAKVITSQTWEKLKYERELANRSRENELLRQRIMEQMKQRRP